MLTARQSLALPKDSTAISLLVGRDSVEPKEKAAMAGFAL